MINYKKSLESGNLYTLDDLFSEKNKIVIPDLQRDYCWGNKAWNKNKSKSTELVSGFLENLISIYNDKPYEKFTLGLIYGYESPKNHIQLCDGQQRITTLFLLIGVLNRYSSFKFDKWLISKEELNNDDKEPYLQYSIRESTLYFLSDLVCEYFLKVDNKYENIKNTKWYFNEYDQDPSIQSMLSAIKIINDKLPTELDKNSFGNFIINNLQMLYYDMGDRTRGEETFVIINTTGEPLTATENLKPILLGNINIEKIRIKYSDQWEEREEWFWFNKNINELTSDNGLKDFFIWYWQIRLLQQRKWINKKPFDLDPRELFIKRPIVEDENEENPELSRWKESKTFNLDLVHCYFNALKNLIDLCNISNTKNVLNSIKEVKGSITLSWFRNLKQEETLNIILPLISFCNKFKEPKLFYEFVRRIRKNYFDKKWKDRAMNFVDWRYVVQLIELSEYEDDVLKFDTSEKSNNFKKIKNVKLVEWYNEEEQKKNELKVYNTLNPQQFIF